MIGRMSATRRSGPIGRSSATREHQGRAPGSRGCRTAPARRQRLLVGGELLDLDRRGSLCVMLAEVARVLCTRGSFLFYGAHPCFNGPHVENCTGGSRTVHPTHRNARRHTSAPWWSDSGIRAMTGGLRHVPLAEFLNAFTSARFHVEHVSEPGTELSRALSWFEPVPWSSDSRPDGGTSTNRRTDRVMASGGMFRPQSSVRIGCLFRGRG